jgi:hypothetical protein
VGGSERLATDRTLADAECWRYARRTSLIVNTAWIAKGLQHDVSS